MADKINVLIVGSGGREQALAQAFARSAHLGRAVIGPGNPGTKPPFENVALDSLDGRALIALCQREAIGLVVIGPEAPLVAGVADGLRAAGVAVFGPGAKAARLEGSKAFTKAFCAAHAIPTARAALFHSPEEAKIHLKTQADTVGLPIVLKADGLAAGKGVIVAHTLQEALGAVDHLMGAALGEAGQTLLIEEYLEGEEISFFALCDGERAVAFMSAQDHKRVGEGDTGANTGGMGAYAPAPQCDAQLTQTIMATIITPTLNAMSAAGTPYRGVLFAGVMLTRAGPKLIEFNVRFGDPETQAMLPLIDEDLLVLLDACARGALRQTTIALKSEVALSVVLAAQGYPHSPRPGGLITGLAACDGKDVIITQAGTALVDGALVAHGGRVLNVTALGDTYHSARRKAYDALAGIHYADGFFRRDIGHRALAFDDTRQAAYVSALDDTRQAACVSAKAMP